MCGGTAPASMNHPMKASPERGEGNIDEIARHGEDSNTGNAMDLKPSTSSGTASLVPSFVSAQLQKILSSSSITSNNNILVSVPFECSHKLDTNSLQALHHDEFVSLSNVD